MARTPPIPAQQPPDATRTAAGHVAALAAVQAAAVQTAVSVTLAALVWPLIPAARAAAGLASALDPRPLLRPLPDQQVLVRPGGSGCARRAATVPGGSPGTGRAAGALTLGVEEEFVLLDPASGAAVPAGPGLAAALAGAADGHHRQLPDRRRARHRMGQLAVRAPVPLADRDRARGVAGRGRLRRGGPPPDRPRAALDERNVYFWPGCPRATRPWRSGSPTSAWTPAPRCW